MARPSAVLRASIWEAVSIPSRSQPGNSKAAARSNEARPAGKRRLAGKVPIMIVIFGNYAGN